MANMSQSDRNAMERATTGGDSLIRPRNGSTRGMLIFLVVGLVILGLLSYAAIDAIHGWDHWVVIADLLIFTAAIAFFVRNRTEDGHQAAAASGDEGWRPTKGI